MANIEKNPQSNLDRDLFALTLERTANASLQIQLMQALRNIIQSSPGYAGVRLPASRALAAELSVSRTTVQAAYDQMISEGYLVTRQGSGTFFADDITHLSAPKTGTASARQTVRPWVPFQAGLPDPSLLPHAVWARHLERAWRAPAPELLGRTDPLGWYPLRDAIADHLAAWRQLDCDPEQVVITSGAWESFEIVFRGLMQPGNTVAVEDPCWPKTHELLATTGAKAHPLRIDDNGLDAEKIPLEARAAIVTPSRHYPTGRSMPLPRRIALLEWASRTDGLIVEDDYDSEFRYQGHPLPSFAGLDGLQHTIYLGSFSKLISTSLRLGYLVVPKHLPDAARDYLGRVGMRASLVAQPALATFMQSGEFAAHLRRMRRIYARRQARLVKALAPVADLLDVKPDPSGMHLCLPFRKKLEERISDQDISAQAQQIGLNVAALSAHCVLPDRPQALLLGYAAFDEDVLSEAAATLCRMILDHS